MLVGVAVTAMTLVVMVPTPVLRWRGGDGGGVLVMMTAMMTFTILLKNEGDMRREI